MIFIMDIIGKYKLYFIISTLIIIPGIISLLLFNLKFSIDFTGGSLWEFKIVNTQDAISKENLLEIVREQKQDTVSIITTGENIFLFRLKEIDQQQKKTIEDAIKEKLNVTLEELRFETVGPTIGRELTRKALVAVVTSCLAIVLYIAWAFRGVPRELGGSWRFGITAIIALIHDILLVVGSFSLLGQLYNVEIDALFITALLTIMGFSVHDSIVVFDRIRENLKRMPGVSYARVVNESLLQTIGRSLSTSVTVIFTLFALLLFSSGSLFWFLIAFLIGIITGTYSSIFIASPLLVIWQRWGKK